MNFFLLISIHFSVVVLAENNVKILSGLDKRFDRDAHIIQLKCSKDLSTLYYDIDSKQWSHSSIDSCLNTPIEILSYCQRIYPKLHVINIVKIIDNAKFRFCDNDCRNQDKIIEGNLYKCLYGAYKSTQQLYIPQNCQFQHLMNPNECKSIDLWNSLAKQKCKSIDSTFFLTNSSVMLQWCDAFKGGISTFNGIEFVCCSIQNQMPKVKYEDDNIDDEDSKESLESDERDSFESFKSSKDETEKIQPDEQHYSSFFNYISSFFLLGFFMTISLFTIYIFMNRNKKKALVVNDQLYKNEDSQLNNMQINGYENPTYKFFDEQNKVV